MSSCKNCGMSEDIAKSADQGSTIFYCGSAIDPLLGPHSPVISVACSKIRELMDRLGACKDDVLVDPDAWLLRVMVEFYGLKEKIDKLKLFLDRDNAELGIDAYSIELLYRQLKCMREYRDVLDLRITNETTK